MVKILFLLLFTELCVVLTGLLFFRFLEKQFSTFQFKHNEFPLPMVAVIGLAIFGFFAQFINLLLPINESLIGAFFLLLCGLAFLNRGWLKQYFSSFSWKLNKKTTLIAGGLFLIFLYIILESAADSNSITDDGLYHIQSSMWIADFPTVPGLAIIHDRFGFNSIWEPLSTLIGFRFLNPRNEFYFLATPVLAINLVAYLFLELQRKASTFYKFSCTLFLMGFLYLTALHDLGVIKNDLPATFLVWFSFLLFLRITASVKQPEFNTTVWNIGLITISLFAILCKVSVMFVFILPVFSMIYTGTFSKILQKISLLLFFSLPVINWVIRSVLLSGYFLYPPFHPAFGLPLPWKLPYAQANNAAQWIVSWARIPKMSKDVVLAMSFWEWFPKWVGSGYKPDRLLIFSGAIATLFLLFAILFSIKRHQKTLRSLSPECCLFVWMIISLVYWFSAAPAPRFYYGPLFPTIATLALSLQLVLPEAWWKSVSALINRWHVFAIIAVLLLGFVASDNFRDGLSGNLIEPAPYPSHSTQTMIINELEFSITDPGSQCWGEALPCTPYPPQGIQNIGSHYRPVYIKESP